MGPAGTYGRRGTCGCCRGRVRNRSARTPKLLAVSPVGELGRDVARSRATGLCRRSRIAVRSSIAARAAYIYAEPSVRVSSAASAFAASRNSPLAEKGRRRRGGRRSRRRSSPERRARCREDERVAAKGEGGGEKKEAAAPGGGAEKTEPQVPRPRPRRRLPQAKAGMPPAHIGSNDQLQELDNSQHHNCTVHLYKKKYTVSFHSSQQS